MNRGSVDSKGEMLPDNVKQQGIYFRANRGNVQFHLDPPDPEKIFRMDLPFRTFAIAF